MFERLFDSRYYREARKSEANQAFIEWSAHFRPSHVSPWVHHAVDRDVPWHRAREYDPPFPGPAPGKGHPLIHVVVAGVLMRFASLAEFDHVLTVFERRAFPDPRAVVRRFIEEGRLDERYRNEHWIMRMPSWAQRPVFRQDAARFMRSVRDDIERELTAAYDD